MWNGASARFLYQRRDNELEEGEMPFDKTAATLVGKSIPQPDALEKAVGKTLFSDDFRMPGMICGKALRSPYANARLKSLVVGRARKLKGVHAVLTADRRRPARSRQDESESVLRRYAAAGKRSNGRGGRAGRLW